MMGTTAAEWATQTEVALRDERKSADGTFDAKAGAEQMKAIDMALRLYFDTDNWLAARDEQMPAMRRRSIHHVT